MKKFLEEFKAFALKGNMFDMAIGVLVGGAFTTLVTSFTDNLISPLLGALGGANFDSYAWDVFGDGKLVFTYGAFLTALVNFLITALVLFFMVKAINKLREATEKKEEPAPEAPKGPTQEELLTDILAELKKQNTEG